MLTFRNTPQLADKKANFHCHTTRCKHAEGEDRAYVEAAIEAGFEILGFSDHAPYLFGGDYISPIRMDMAQLEGYFDSVEALKREYARDITIYGGLEMEFFPEYFDATLETVKQYPIDYLLLAQHFLDSEIGWRHVMRPAADGELALRTYVERISEALEREDFLYVAHPDIIHPGTDPDVYRRYMIALARLLTGKGIPIEINVAGCRSELCYPSREFISMGVECGAQFIIGVDAHAPRELLDRETYTRCARLARCAGGALICSPLLTQDPLPR
ncbi:MAG: histidinol-phosphatase [Oscillospiraceae bacterium]|nr:histidinol-phosphatase [Oscillospiraceae bacterium]